MAVICEKTIEMRSSIEASATIAAHRTTPVAIITKSAQYSPEHAVDATGDSSVGNDHLHDGLQTGQKRNR